MALVKIHRPFLVAADAMDGVDLDLYYSRKVLVSIGGISLALCDAMDGIDLRPSLVALDHSAALAAFLRPSLLVIAVDNTMDGIFLRPSLVAPDFAALAAFLRPSLLS